MKKTKRSENELNKFQKSVLPYLPQICKPRIQGCWGDIQKTLASFGTGDIRMFRGVGVLIKYIKTTDGKYPPYMFGVAYKGIKLRKRNGCFYAVGDSGQVDISDDWKYYFKLLEMPEGMWHLNIKDVQKYYRISLAPKPQYKYY